MASLILFLKSIIGYGTIKENIRILERYITDSLKIDGDTEVKVTREYARHLNLNLTPHGIKV